jgi:hypothetical protein
MQSKYVNIKTVFDPSKVEEQISALWPDCSICWASHLENGKVPHSHFVVRSVSTTRWDKLREWLMRVDPHSYSAPARSWSKSVRYLLHLDNPEKERIPFESLRTVNIDDSELSTLLGSRKAPILADLASIGSRSPFAAFEYLVCERGHNPSEVSSAIRCLIDLERFRTFQKQVGLTNDEPCENRADLSNDFHFFTQSLSDSILDNF